VKNVHGILHKALQQAVANGYIRFNPTNSCILPRAEKKELQPLDEAETKLFLDGGLYQGYFGAIRENVREKEKPPQGIPNFHPAKVPKIKKKSGQDEFPNRISMAE